MGWRFWQWESEDWVVALFTFALICKIVAAGCLIAGMILGQPWAFKHH